MAALRSLNKHMIIGNVGKPPEFHKMNNDRELARFSVATSESWKNKQTGEYDEETVWHNIVCFNSHIVGVIKKHVGKGTMVYIEGKVVTRKYRKQDEDFDRYTTETIIGNYDGELKILARGEDVDPDANAGDMGAAGGGNDPDFKDDIPF